MIEKPPKITKYNATEISRLLNIDNINNLVADINTKYLYWSDVKYKNLPAGITHEQLWECVKWSRAGQMLLLWNKYNVKIPFTPDMQSMCHELDMQFRGFWGSSATIDEQTKQLYLISSIMEESIASSIMEGASTTRRKAKEMLRKGQRPKTKSEKMIYNNYRSIQFIIEHKDDTLTPELILALHKNMTSGTLDDMTDEGKFRTNNDVVVVDGITNEVFHEPPQFEDIPKAIDTICRLFNGLTPKNYIHPILKGIIIHFIIAFVHPFVDGNGRTARALFYWYMLKNGYWLIQYISISRVIYSSKRQYEKSFLYVEHDDYDLGYFIIYNLRVLLLAFKDFKLYIERKSAAIKTLNSFEAIGNINGRQAKILQTFIDKPDYHYTIKELAQLTGAVRQTVQMDMNRLVAIGAMKKIKINQKQFIYGKGDNYDSIIEQKK